MWEGSCTVDFHFPRTAFLGRNPIPMGFDDVRGIVRILQAPPEARADRGMSNQLCQALGRWRGDCCRERMNPAYQARKAL